MVEEVLPYWQSHLYRKLVHRDQPAHQRRRGHREWFHYTAEFHVAALVVFRRLRQEQDISVFRPARKQYERRLQQASLVPEFQRVIRHLDENTSDRERFEALPPRKRKNK